MLCRRAVRALGTAVDCMVFFYSFYWKSCMKKLVLFVGVVVCLYGASAQTGEKLEIRKTEFGIRKSPASILGGFSMRPVIIDTLYNAYSFNATYVNPIDYDPISNTVALVYRGTNNPATSSVNTGNEIFLRYSGDNGKTWSEKLGPMLNESVANMKYGRYPSVKIYNPGGMEKDPSKLTYGIAYSLFFNGEFQYTAGGIYQNATKQFGMDTEYSLDGQKFRYGTDCFPLFSNDGNLFNFGGIFPLTTSSAVSALALRTFVGTKWVAVQPDNWDWSVLSPPNDNWLNTAQAGGTGRDTQGNMYVGFFGIFSEYSNDYSKRGLSYSKSSNNGDDWTNLNIMPLNILEEYITSVGGLIDETRITGARRFPMPDNSVGEYYNGYSFVALAEDNVSFFTSITNFAEIVHYIEVNVNKGVWSIKKVHEADPTSFVFHIGQDNLYSAQTGAEMDIAVTADGTKMVAKWVAGFNQIYNEDIDKNGMQPDTIFTTDIFMSWRDVNNGTWSAPVNVTNDLFLDKLTHIPKTIRSINDIPLVQVCATLLNPADDKNIDSMIIKQDSTFIKSYVAMRTIDLGSVVGVQDNESAKSFPGETLAVHNDHLSTALHITYSTGRSGMISVDLVDIMGNAVQDVVHTAAEPGLYGIVADISSVPSGMYLVRLRTDDSQVVRQIVIVR